MSSSTGIRQWALKYPNLGTEPIPVEPCLSPDYFETERKKIFRRVWLNVAREDELPAAGDYIVCDIEVLGSSIIIVRGRDGRIRAFHNVCSHRGNKVATDSRGQCRTFVCGFHGWAYDLEGALSHVPDEENFFGLNRAACGLKPVAAGTWEGFVFVNLSPEPEQSLDAFIGEWGEALEGYPFDAMALRHHYRAEIKVNWKIAMDAFQEAWHARFVHKRSGGAAYASRENPYIHALEFKLFPLHRMMSVPGNPEFTPTPLQGVAHRFGSSYIKMEEYETRLPKGVNPQRSPLWMFDSNYVFPNFSLFVFGDMFFTYHFWPLAVDRTLWETKTYYPEPGNAGELFSQEYAKCALRDTWLEDLSTLENIQAAISSGTIDHFILQDQEILVRHSHKVIAEHVEQPGVEGGAG